MWRRCDFELDSERSMLHYEQRTERRNRPDDPWVASHWESGFIILGSDGSVTVNNAQSGGRVEVLEGAFSAENGALTLSSRLLANDDRMQTTSRMYEIEGDTLRYTMGMATTAVSPLEGHLSAELQRVS